MLDRLYKGNELAQESQDIVLKRARRRLKRTKEALKLRQRAHDRSLKYDIPKIEKEKTFRTGSQDRQSQ